MQAVFPSDDHSATNWKIDPDAESKMALLIGVISGIRNIRGEMNISPSLPLDVSVQSDLKSTRETIDRHKEMIISLARLKSIDIEPVGIRPKSAATAVVDDATVFVLLEGIIDFSKEIKRLGKKINKVTNELTDISKKLRNEDFLGKAPTHVVEKVKERHRAMLEKQEKLQSNLDKIKEFEV